MSDLHHQPPFPSFPNICKDAEDKRSLVRSLCINSLAHFLSLGSQDGFASTTTISYTYSKKSAFAIHSGPPTRLTSVKQVSQIRSITKTRSPRLTPSTASASFASQLPCAIATAGLLGCSKNSSQFLIVTMAGKLWFGSKASTEAWLQKVL